MNSLSEIQKQIKAFNKALQRADKLGRINNDFYAQIMDLIDMERMTRGGYAKAGKKYLESMSYKDILAYQSDIKQAKGLVDLANITDILDIEGAKDPKSLLWKIYDKIDTFKAFDSEQVYLVAEGKVDVDYKKMALEMYKYLNDPNYDQGDFDEWFDNQAGLEWGDILGDD